MRLYRGSSMVIIIWGGTAKKDRDVEPELWSSQEVSIDVMLWCCWWRSERDSPGFQKEQRNQGKPPHDCGIREFEEETTLQRHIIEVLGDPIVDTYRAHYIVSYVPSRTIAWYRQKSHNSSWDVRDDPEDRDPVVFAKWLRKHCRASRH